MPALSFAGEAGRIVAICHLEIYNAQRLERTRRRGARGNRWAGNHACCPHGPPQLQMKFLLIDDHALFRSGLRMLLEKMQGAHRFLEAESCEAGFAAAAAHPDIDIILLDLALPGMNGLDGLLRLRELCPAAPVVLLSANESSQFIVDGMQRGAQGFIPKSATPEVMMSALQAVLDGGTYVPAQDCAVRKDVPGERRGLTGRQREVLALICRSLTNKEIATALGMRVNTVRVHVAAIFDTLGVDNRVDAARVGLSEGWLDHER